MQTPVIKLCCKTCSHSAYLETKNARHCFLKYKDVNDSDYCGIWDSKGSANNEAIAEFENNNERNTENV